MNALFGSLSLLVLAVALGAGCGKPAATHKGHDHSGLGHKPAPVTGVPPEQRDPKRLWCTEHNRYEDRCWLCHPELQDKNRAYCNTHSLYEDECFLCQPALKPAPQTNDGKLMCREHNVPEAECAICHPELTGKTAAKVRLPAADSARLTGIETALPTVGAATDAIACVAEIQFDQNQLTQITAPAGGILQNVDADLGAQVKEHQPLAKIWSASIADTVAKAVLSHQTLERERKLRADGIAPAKDLQEAEALHRAACQQARTFGFTEADLDAIGQRHDDAVYLTVRAPFAGEIIERNAVRGARVEEGKTLFTLADRATMWAMLTVPETALPHVAVGQPVTLTVDALPGRVFTGKVTWVSAQVDDRTRLAKVRAEVPNADGVLRDKMFAQARILIRHTEKAVLVPPSAIQRVAGQPLVFVKLADDLFEARGVRLGAKHNGHVEVVAGLKPDEPVVVAHGFAVKSQLLISRLGAGCADD